MKYIYLIIILLYYSCTNQQIALNQLPVVKGGLEYEQNEGQFKERIELNGTAIYQLLKTQNPEVENLNGIAKFSIEEMDSTQLRPFELYLCETIIQKESKWYMLSVSKGTTEVIDSYEFNPDSLELRFIHQHSSKLDHDGIAIEFIEDLSTKDSMIIYNHYVEVFETGEIKLISRSDASSEIFKLLTSSLSNTGNYNITENDIHINLILKDGLSSPNYSYKLNIFTPEGCIHTYLNLDSRVVDNIIEIDSIGSFRLTLNDGSVGIRNNKFESACDDIFELYYDLNKTNDNK